MRHNAKAMALVAAKLAQIEATRNAGRDYFKTSPDLMLVEVSRHAGVLYGMNNDLIIAFLRGYADARIRHDEYKQEKLQ